VVIYVYFHTNNVMIGRVFPEQNATNFVMFCVMIQTLR